MMSAETHYRKLEHLYYAAPIQQLYEGIRITITHETCKITYEVAQQHFHAGNALHGAVYFKMLDDAAFFAASSVEFASFVVTGTFAIKLLKPVTGGTIIAIGQLNNTRGKVFTASAELRNQQGELLATGEGVFIKTGLLLDSLSDYSL